MPCHKARQPPPAKPESQHYSFAHRLLPALFFEDPAGFVGALRRDGDGVLAALWAVAGELRPERGAAATLAQDVPAAPACEIRCLPNDSTLVIITLPAPQASAEAYFVALLLVAPREGGEPTGWVYTLEFANHHELTKAMFCGWTADGVHVNHGAYVPPTSDEFAAAVAREMRH